MNWSNYYCFYPLFPVTFAFQLLPGTLPVYRQLFLQHTVVLCPIATAAVVFLRKICVVTRQRQNFVCCMLGDYYPPLFVYRSRSISPWKDKCGSLSGSISAPPSSFHSPATPSMLICQIVPQRTISFPPSLLQRRGGLNARVESRQFYIFSLMQKLKLYFAPFGGFAFSTERPGSQ